MNFSESNKQSETTPAQAEPLATNSTNSSQPKNLPPALMRAGRRALAEAAITARTAKFPQKKQ